MASTIERNTQAQPNNQNISDPEWVHNARMEEYRRVLYSGAEIPESDVIAEPAPKKAPMFADSVPAEAPSAAERLAQYHPIYAPSSPRNLFENVELKNGELVSVVPNAQVVAPAAVASVGAAVAPAPVVIPEADDADARPTPRTMASLNARTETQQSFFASLSTRTKVVLAAIAAAIVLVIALICINTAILNSLDAQIAEKQTIVNELEQQSKTIQEAVKKLQENDDYINEWAESVGMTRS